MKSWVAFPSLLAPILTGPQVIERRGERGREIEREREKERERERERGHRRRKRERKR